MPGFGDPAARIVVLGLAPAAHGANRTGRVFTGDRSGDWLFRAMHRAGLANQPTSMSLDDGLALTDAWVTAAVKCAPPDNKPSPSERDTCAPFLERELAALPNAARGRVPRLRSATRRRARHFGVRPRPKFGHGVEVAVAGEAAAEAAITLLCSFHPSQQNTFTSASPSRCSTPSSPAPWTSRPAGSAHPASRPASGQVVRTGPPAAGASANPATIVSAL